MKNFMDILSDAGIEVAEDKVEALNKALNENYKTIAEFEKRVKRLETERDGYKDQLDTATESLRNFEGVDIESLKAEIAEAQKKAKEAEDGYRARLEERDFEDTLKAEMAQYKFSSKAAEKSVYEQVRGAGLKCVDGKIMGLNDYIATLKENDADAFVEETEKEKARFSSPMNGGNGSKYSSAAEIMKIKDTAERQAAIASNIELFT